MEPDQMARGMATSVGAPKRGLRGPRLVLGCHRYPDKGLVGRLAIRSAPYPHPPGPKHSLKKIRILGANRSPGRPGIFFEPVRVWYNSRRRAGSRYRRERVSWSWPVTWWRDERRPSLRNADRA